MNTADTMEQILTAAKQVASTMSDQAGDGFLVVAGNPEQYGFPGEYFGCAPDRWKPEDYAVCIAHLIRELATKLNMSSADLAALVASETRREVS